MNPVAYHIVTGQAFFSGCALAAAGVCLRTWTVRRFLRALARVALFCAAALVTLSATPLPLLAYAGWTATTLLWLVAAEGLARRRPALSRWLAVLAAAWPVLLAAIELPHHLPPAIPEGPHGTLYVIGDSVSAGLSREGEVTWPALLREQFPRVRVVDVSRAGATVSSAAAWQASKVQEGSAVVCVEIGGNDLLGERDMLDIERQFDMLLQRVSGPGRLVVMLELPLPPFANGYGRIQRRLARRYGAVLVPKRCFAGILAPAGNTVDGIHLSNAGHRAMAAMWHDLLAPALTGGQSAVRARGCPTAPSRRRA